MSTTPEPRPVPALRTLRERQLALVVLSVGTLMIILDSSVVNVALPTIQAELGFSQSELAWVINAYLIPFGGLLLLAGRLGDLFGRKRLFLGGLALFTAASAACGLAQTKEMLIGARFVQGIGGAMASAVVLGMIVTIFPGRREQARAISIYAFVAASGASVGLLAGAALTEAVNWHWIFFVNLPIGVVAILFAARLLDENRDGDTGKSPDVLGGVLITAGLSLLTYTIVQAADHGWVSARTLLLAAGALVLVLGFVYRQARAKNPLVPLGIFRARNVGWANLIQTLMVAGFAGMFFLGALYLQNVLGYSVAEIGFAYLPLTVAIAVLSLKAAPKLIEKVDARTLLVPGLLLVAGGLAFFARVPVDGTYWVDVFPVMVLLGVGAGICFPALLTAAMSQATSEDAGVRSGLVSTTQQIGPALGLAVLAALSTARTRDAVAEGEPLAEALTSGYQLAFLIGTGFVLVAIALTVTVLKPAAPKTAPEALDHTTVGDRAENLTGVRDPEFLALGLGGTNMMAMLWSVAMGRRSVGVEMRGDPNFGVMHWQVREELYHHLAEIDRMMLARYGADRIPKRGDGSLFLLSECFYSTKTQSGDVAADEVVSGFDLESHVGGVLRHSEHIDDRWVDGVPNRVVRAQGAATPPAEPDPSVLGRDMSEVLESRSVFLSGAEELLVLLRRYLEGIEAMDLAAGVESPRVRLFLSHQVVDPTQGLGRATQRGADQPGFERLPDGRVRVRIEAIRNLDYKGRFKRVIVPGTEVIDLGVPEVFVVAQGQHSEDAERLGFTQREVMIDHGDGRGPVVAQADYLSGLIEVLIDSRIRQRVATEFDKEGLPYTVRQVVIGHEDDAEIGWTLVEVPEFKTFDPVLAGLVPVGTPIDSAEYFAAHQHLLRDFFLEQTSLLVEVSKAELAKVQLTYGPKLFRLVEKIGEDALLTPNGVVAGDSFGNGHFGASGGAMTGMIGHGSRVLRYWQARDAGVAHEDAVRALADGIKEDTEAWLKVSEREFSPLPDGGAGVAATIEATRKHRTELLLRDHSDEWTRVVIVAGRLHAFVLPELSTTHPATRTGPLAAEAADELAPARNS
ncbi:MFS transporter [Actinokineospora iranica]|uniref:Drug resistance transporter, EmrB/QacA subfamily n=1 Tax=Actinokineospora iranica TaxID=1271860 RepID=A0A1G6UCX2_9PSEU|nr:MFS transporter [Actinokineospora iranica]SDD38437.1 drug resistance transporter, EmrB/QacA subfamily [Actinokineospora iranica]